MHITVNSSAFNLPLDVPNGLPQIFLEGPLLAGTPEIFDGITQIEGHVFDDGDALDSARVRVVMFRVINFLLAQDSTLRTVTSVVVIEGVPYHTLGQEGWNG